MLLSSGLAYSSLQVHQVSAMVAVGLSLSAAATATAIRGLLSLPGRAVLAVAVGRLGVAGSLLGVHVLMLTGTAALALAGPLWLLAGYILLSGLAYGMQAPLSNLYAIEVYGERRMGTLLGVQRLIVGVGSASGPVLLGLVADATGGYRVGLIGVIGLAAAAIALMLTMPPSAPAATQVSRPVRG
jgi:MFS family permease